MTRQGFSTSDIQDLRCDLKNSVKADKIMIIINTTALAIRHFGTSLCFKISHSNFVADVASCCTFVTVF